MSETRKEIESKLELLAIEAEKLETQVLGLAARIARNHYVDLLPAAVSASAHLDHARRALSNPDRVLGGGGSTGQEDPAPIESGGGGIRA